MGGAPRPLQRGKISFLDFLILKIKIINIERLCGQPHRSRRCNYGSTEEKGIQSTQRQETFHMEAFPPRHRKVPQVRRVRSCTPCLQGLRLLQRQRSSKDQWRKRQIIFAWMLVLKNDSDTRVFLCVRVFFSKMKGKENEKNTYFNFGADNGGFPADGVQ